LLWIVGLLIVGAIFWSEGELQFDIPSHRREHYHTIVAAYGGIGGLMIIGWILSKPSWTQRIAAVTLRIMNGVFNRRSSVWLRAISLTMICLLGWVSFGVVMIEEGSDFASAYPVTRVGETSEFNLAITLNTTHLRHGHPYHITIALTNISNETQHLGFYCTASKQWPQPWLRPSIRGVTYTYRYDPVMIVGYGTALIAMSPGETMTATHTWTPLNSMPEGIYTVKAVISFCPQLQSLRSDPVFVQLTA
jgi:hypothetical protein